MNKPEEIQAARERMMQLAQSIAHDVTTNLEEAEKQYHLNPDATFHPDPKNAQAYNLGLAQVNATLLVHARLTYISLQLTDLQLLLTDKQDTATGGSS